MRTCLTIAIAALALAACNQQPAQTNPTNEPAIKVRSSGQGQLHQLDALNLAIALRRAIYDAGYTCKRITDAGFVGAYKYLDMWLAHCVYASGEPRDWAVFAGPGGSAQVRDCRDVEGTELPKCAIKQRPKGSFGFTK